MCRSKKSSGALRYYELITHITQPSPCISSLICLMGKGTQACKIHLKKISADLWRADEERGAQSYSKDSYDKKNEHSCIRHVAGICIALLGIIN